MTAPVFVNAGSVGNRNFGTDVTPSLPASRVNGNLLIAMVVEDGIGGTRSFATASTGWVGPFASQTSSGVNSALFYCVVDGSEVDPIITWTGNAAVNAIIYQYSGVASGFTPTNFAHTVSTGTTVTEGGITTTANDSLVAVLVGGANSTTTVGSATGYTADQAATGASGNETLAAFSQTQATSGTASTAFSTTVGTGGSNPGWVAYSVELASTAAAPSEADITASEAVGVTLAAQLSVSGSRRQPVVNCTT